jgi:hypothetical protein
MTTHRVGKTNTKDPRGGRYGKFWKRATTRYLRRAGRAAARREAPQVSAH